MAEFHVKSLGTPDEVIEFPRLTVRVVDLGDITVGWFVNEPGWSWYEDVRPGVGGEWCQARHLGMILSGRLGVEFEDGAKLEFGPEDVRAGVHVGEVELVGRDVRGVAVHEAARIMSAAGASEILVSETVRLFSGSDGLTFEDRGAHELKGLQGEWRLWRFVPEDAGRA